MEKTISLIEAELDALEYLTDTANRSIESIRKLLSEIKSNDNT